MLFPFLLFMTVGGVVIAAVASESKPGTRPFDNLPPEASGNPAQVVKVKSPSSGRSYKVSSWRPVSGRAYYVAELVGPTNIWVAYWFDKASGGRLFARGRAENRAQLTGMLNDLKVQATAATEEALPAS